MLITFWNIQGITIRTKFDVFCPLLFQGKKKTPQVRGQRGKNKIENDKVTLPGNSDNTVSLLEKRD